MTEEPYEKYAKNRAQCTRTRFGLEPNNYSLSLWGLSIQLLQSQFSPQSLSPLKKSTEPQRSQLVESENNTSDI